MIQNFQEIKHKRKIAGVCKLCSKTRTRTITEEQTVNPFNKNTDGTIKSHFEVSQSVIKKLDERVARFISEGFVCKLCKEYLGY